MKSWRPNINGIFLTLLVVGLFCGCKTTEEKKKDKVKAILRFHLEVNPDGTPRQGPVPIFRQRPEMVTIEKTSFLDSANIIETAVVELEGGYGIRVQFDRQGSHILENISARNSGKRIAVQAAWPQIRWLAAPRMTRRIADGVLIFTPDATREESEEIVLGVNNIAKNTKSKIWP